MNAPRQPLAALSAACLALALCAFAAPRPASGRQRAPRGAGAAGLVFTDSVLGEVAREVAVVEAAPPAGLKRDNLTADAGGRYRAFTVEAPSRGDGLFDRIFFTDLRARRTFEIRNLPDAHRPFDGLRFTRGGVLQFDRWAGPHGGVRYRLDVRRRRLVSARVFFDAGYVERQKRPQEN